jgi:hypothetical protein
MRSTAVDGAMAAKCLGISRRQHSALVASQTLPRASARGRYDLAATVRAYIEHKTKSAPSQLNVAKTSKAQGEAALLHMRAAERAGELIALKPLTVALEGLVTALYRSFDDAPLRVPELSEIARINIAAAMDTAKLRFADGIAKLLSPVARAQFAATKAAPLRTKPS